MKDLFQQIRAASSANLYYVALFPSLALPDICGALESANGEASPTKYAGWFDRWVTPNYTVQGRVFFSGEDCYYYRCSLLHQGSSQHRKSTYSRVLFVEPGASTNVFHMNILNDALNIDVRLFCTDIVGAAEMWLAQVQNTPEFRKNYPRFLARYDRGLAPYLVGVPVIA